MGMPFADGGPRLHLMVDHVGLRETLANVIRGLSVHTVAPSAILNAHTERGVRTLIGWIGEDPDDPGAVWPGTKFELHHFSVHEIYAGNPLHLLLFAVAMCLLVWKRRQIPAPRTTLWYAAGIVALFVFFAPALANSGKPPSPPLFCLPRRSSGSLDALCPASRLPSSACCWHMRCASPSSTGPARWFRGSRTLHGAALLTFTNPTMFSILPTSTSRPPPRISPPPHT